MLRLFKGLRRLEARKKQQGKEEDTRDLRKLEETIKLKGLETDKERKRLRLLEKAN